MKNKYLLLIILIIILFIGIFIFRPKNKVVQIRKSISVEDSLRNVADSLLKHSEAVMGYRFVVFGDFDGDHRTDTLLERYTDSTFREEAPKYYYSSDTNFAYDQIIFLSQYLKRESFIEWKKLNLKLSGGQLGFHYIENCGDVNLDGKDELLLVSQHADFSNLNTAHIYTYENKDWKEIYSIPVWEWQFPETPSATMVPGMFGNYAYATCDNDSINKLLEKDLKEFRFIHHYSDNSIEFSCENPLWDEKRTDEMDSIGAQKFFKRYFDKMYINDSVYLRDKSNPAICYKVTEEKSDKNKKEIIFGIDDPAEMLTCRIYINHSKSPFRK